MGYERVKDILSLMSPFTGTAFVVLLVTALVEFIIYKNKDEIKAKKALLICVIGSIIMLVLALFGFYLTEPTTVEKPNDPDPPTTPTMEENNDFLRFKNGEYKGEYDPVTLMPTGKGVMMYYSGDKYDGEWENGLREGYGVMNYANGEKYDGKWHNNLRDGDGIYIWSDKKQYRGNYKNDLRDGEGDFIGWSDYIMGKQWTGNYHGSFENGKFEGYGEFEFENGDVFEGIFHDNDVWDGILTYSDGSTRRVVNGKPAYY